jgi:hypothetical protein
MPSRKQRRRRQKLQRHEYEYVVETEEGEVPVESLRELEERERQGRDGRERRDGREPALVDRRGRPIQKPTFARVLRRTAIFGPILLVFVYLMSGDELSTAGIIANTVILLAFFIPFSYVVDVLVYRMMLRRHAREKGGSQPPR